MQPKDSHILETFGLIIAMTKEHYVRHAFLYKDVPGSLLINKPIQTKQGKSDCLYWVLNNPVDFTPVLDNFIDASNGEAAFVYRDRGGTFKKGDTNKFGIFTSIEDFKRKEKLSGPGHKHKGSN